MANPERLKDILHRILTTTDEHISVIQPCREYTELYKLTAELMQANFRLAERNTALATENEKLKREAAYPPKREVPPAICPTPNCVLSVSVAHVCRRSNGAIIFRED